jgi:hypothetical protein
MSDPHDKCHDHPLFSYFGPRRPAWPRVLVIGLAANDNRRICDHAGRYVLKNTVAFWNVSHRIVGQAAGFPGLGMLLTRAAIERGSSPIAYADASPVGIPAGTGRPSQSIRADQYIANADRLLALSETAPAVCRLVVISGAWNSPQMAFFRRVTDVFLARGTPVVTVPFFSTYFANDPAFAERLRAPRVQPILRDILTDWARAS